jgi:ankyrin repeat protein
MQTVREMAHANFLHLKKTITQRQEFEKNNKDPKINTAAHPTDLNYFDLRGKTLLHYAAEEGNLAYVKELIHSDVNINLKNLDYGKGTASPLEVALQNGNLAVSQYLFEQGADCYDIHMRSVHSTCRVWFEKVIRSYINSSVRSAQFGERLTDDDGIDRLSRAVEIGDLSYIEKNTPLLQTNHLNIAAANGKRDVVLFLIKNNKSVDPIALYSESALQEAIRYGHLDIAADLLKAGAQINWQNSDKETALFIAVGKGDKVAIELLIKNGAGITQLDVHGNTILHKAKITGNLPLLLSLLKPSDIKLLQSIKNIYGDSYDTLNVKRLNQHEWVIPCISYYLRSQYRDTDLLSYGGYCHGLSRLAEYYSGKDKQTEKDKENYFEDYFYDTLDLMSHWDGEPDTLVAKLKNIPQAEFYTTFHELIEQWLNDIAWAHGNFTQVADQSQRRNFQRMFEWQASVSVDDPGLNEITLHDITHNSEGIYRSEAQLSELLKIIQQMPIATRFNVNGALHATSGHVAKNQCLHYYDPNFLSKMELLNRADKLAQIIIDTKYIWPSQRIIAARGKPFDELGNSPIALRLYCFRKDIKQFDNYRFFQTKHLPKSLKEAKEFQANSPNGLTHLHIAVMTRSLLSLIDLLKNGYCDVNTKDKLLGHTALYSAVSQGLGNMAIELLKMPNIDPKNLSKSACLAYKNKMFDVVDKIVDRSEQCDLFKLLVLAVSEDDINLVKRIIESKKVDLNKVSKKTSLNATNRLFITAEQVNAKDVLLYLHEKGLSHDSSKDLPSAPAIDI